MSAHLLEIAFLLASAAAIYFACEFFVNGVEWLGRRLSVGSTATGTILAAIGTALPESVVTFVAVAFAHDDAQRQLGVGAALGGPLVLATIAYAVVGATLLLADKRLKPAGVQDFRRLSRDQAWFLAIFVIKLAIGVVAFAWKPWLGLFFLGAYALYFWREITGEETGEEEKLDPLLIARKHASPPLSLIALQTGAALVAIFLASSFFVHQLDVLAPALGVAPQVLALFLSPIATELPETMNAIIWVRQGKLRLALANISGAMMIQATVPTAFGVIFTPWMLDRTLLVAGGVTLAAVIALWAAFSGGWVNRWFLTGVAALYAIFVLIVVGLH
ncbi:MAG: sodium:calcium antiporter [Proteobacteria bacterium]|nr:sodium:calcium antiporter [Pseudomonadota bacterium]